ncbi:MAG: type II secretion system protein [Acidobacteria bacterium]|nr:MAG: type II secretion system protein [Acidobacteriota bacterium]REK01898.1 MAG: type II secretion system protein [Acidobacteriota bacterium]REK14854.1 MAG: type II secretion system protein [Acidobacteriota bacterium]REK45569.1 MAG: type II secretion system protein [Acidobacteriota bacterium]
MKRIIENLRRSCPPARPGGYTLLELMITLTVLAILVLGTIPIAQNAVRRQKEIRLRQTLRDIRNAIDEFKRDAVGACPLGSITSGNPTQVGQNIPIDPRSRVVIDDCTIFDSENIDRFPPSLDILVEGVRVKPRGLSPAIQGGRPFDDKNATELNEQKEILKVYLREMPVDPITGEEDWILRSSYQTEDAGSWDEVNVFDVRSNSTAEGLNGVAYNEW